MGLAQPPACTSDHRPQVKALRAQQDNNERCFKGLFWGLSERIQAQDWSIVLTIQRAQERNTGYFVLFFFLDFILFLLYFILKLYIIVLVLPNIKMNPSQVYMCSPSWTLLPPHTIPLGRPSAPAPSIQYRASNLDWHLISGSFLMSQIFISGGQSMELQHQSF